MAAILAALGAPAAIVACGNGDGSQTSNTSGGTGTGTGGSAGAPPSHDAGRDVNTSDAGGAHHDAGHHDAADDAADAGDAGDADLGDALPTIDAACGTTVMGFDLAAGIHVPICSYIAWPTNPPTSGEHYPVWAAYKTYDAPVPRGFSVHDLEHGGIVVSYNCPGGCDAEIAALQTFVDARPDDPSCTAPVRSRIVITPDPLLDVRFAAASWGFSLKSSCFDLDALDAFISGHYGMGPEDFCADGIDPTAPDAGIPANCGQAPDGG